MHADATPTIVDTDTASDDAQALLLACLSDRLDVRAVTVVAGNVPFERQVANAKHTLELAGVAVPVYEGARRPLVKDFHHADDIHGEGGLGGEVPETGAASAEGFGPRAIVDAARESPGEVSVLCIGPLTNLALAHAEEPALPDLLDEVWVMGGAVDCAGNVTPSAEYNFWVDPDAARRVLDAFDTWLVDWGLSRRASVIGPDAHDRIAGMGTDLADFFLQTTESLRENACEQGLAGPAMPDSLTAACLAYPSLRETVSPVDATVDSREGLTRGFLSVDRESGDSGPVTRVVGAVDAERYREAHLAMLADRTPDAPF